MRGAKPILVIDNDAVSDVSEPPTWLSADAQAEWRRAMPMLIERKILTTADMATFENYCLSIGRVREAERDLQACDDPELKVKMFRVQDKAMQSARLLAAELGMTPVSRSRPAIRDDIDDGLDLFDFR